MNLRSIIAADGLPRRLFTVADVERMVEVGLIGEDERIELLEGELIPMSPKGNEHEILKTALTMLWGRKRPSNLLFAVETTLRLSAETMVEPDFVVFSRQVGIRGLNARTVLLAVELGATSLGYDLGRKAATYARYGVGELWVVDVLAMVVHVHRRPGHDGYRDVSTHPSNEQIVPLFDGGESFAVRLADLDLTD